MPRINPPNANHPFNRATYRTLPLKLMLLRMSRKDAIRHLLRRRCLAVGARSVEATNLDRRRRYEVRRAWATDDGPQQEIMRRPSPA